MSSEACADAARLGTLELRRRQLLARIVSGAGLASALSALSACGGGGPDDDATLTPLTGWATTINQEGLEQRTAAAIGRSIGQFAITDRSEEAGGRIKYTVNTQDGAVYRCYLYGATGFQKAMSLGQTPHSDAICTATAGGKTASGNQAHAPTGQGGRSAGSACDALLRPAGRC